MGKSIIFYDLKNSFYFYESENFTFYFSSKFYLDKFSNNFLDNRDTMYYKFTGRYQIEFNCCDYFDIIFYASIEKRGFFIKTKTGVEVNCLKEIELNGEIKI